MADANIRPAFCLPFPAGTRVAIRSYKGHNPDDKKMDMYATDWPPVVAGAAGVVHEHFDPGGLEVRHFIPGTTTPGNWFTTYMHMTERVPVGTIVGQAQRVGTAGSVGTGAKHLHHEQLWDATPDGDADTQDMVFPSFVEHNDGRPFAVPVGEPGLNLVSQNRAGHTGSSGGGIPITEDDMFENTDRANITAALNELRQQAANTRAVNGLILSAVQAATPAAIAAAVVAALPPSGGGSGPSLDQITAAFKSVVDDLTVTSMIDVRS